MRRGELGPALCIQVSHSVPRLEGEPEGFGTPADTSNVQSPQVSFFFIGPSLCNEGPEPGCLSTPIFPVSLFQVPCLGLKVTA